jgi:hypothetical protein
MVTKRNLPQEKPHVVPEPKTRPASEIKRAVRGLRGFTSDELRQIPMIEPGAKLKPAAIYLDVGSSPPRVFVAGDSSFVSEGSLCVPKAAVADPLWKRLLAGGERATPASQARRLLQRGEPQPRGGRERSERRGAAPVGHVQTPARHHRMRGH